MGREGAGAKVGATVMMRSFFSSVFLLGSALAQAAAPAISTDPPVDKAHPAGMAVLHIPTHGVLINGLLYSPVPSRTRSSPGYRH